MTADRLNDAAREYANQGHDDLAAEARIAAEAALNATSIEETHQIEINFDANAQDGEGGG